MLKIPRASRQRPGSCSKLCSSSPGLSGATIGTDREVEPAVGVGRPDVVAEQRRAPSSQLRTNMRHRQGGGQRMRPPLPSIGAVSVKLRRDDGYRDVSGASERSSGILESHLATSEESYLVHRP
jgi:hypothetical protein